MNIKITADRQITEKEVNRIVAEEKERYSMSGKELAEVELTLEKNEIIVKSYELSPIRRIRRITGYLSDERNFNTAKQAELHSRLVHNCA